jgi:EAL domain-containing protein (putative c-di-GMP-specific phosphodiesterase class I)
VVPTILLALCFQPLLAIWGDTRKVEVLVADATTLKGATMWELLRHDLQALRQSCHQCLVWQDIAPGLEISVNILPSYLEIEDFADWVVEIIAQSGLPARLVTLEIVESEEFKYNNPTVINNLLRLCRAGIKLALDDVGSGHMSDPEDVGLLIQALEAHGIHIHVMKLDRDKVEKLETAIGRLEAGEFMKIAHSSGILVVAEGASTPGQLDQAVRLGCLQFQCYMLGAKAPAAKITALLRERAVPIWPESLRRHQRQQLGTM